MFIKRNAFTLVELLITISIIAILATIAIVTYQQVLKNSRDAKRQADLKLIQSALEQYRADQGFYPPAINFAVGGDVSLTNATGQTGVTVTRTYLKAIPHDPRSTDYSYTAYKDVAIPTVCATASDCVDYCLYSQVENSANAKDTACTNDATRTLEVTKP